MDIKDAVASIYKDKIRQIKEEIKQNNHASSFLLVGFAGIGKREIALAIAKDEEFEYMIFDEEEATLKVDKMRNEIIPACAISTLKKRRIVILTNIERMNDESANTFLKTLEEPPANTVFLLTCSNEFALPNTILSRAQTVYVATPTATALADVFNLDKNSDEIQMSDCVTKKLFEYINDEKALDVDKTQFDFWLNAIKNKNRIAMMKEVEKMYIKDKFGNDMLANEVRIMIKALKEIGNMEEGIENCLYYYKKTVDENVNRKLTLTQIVAELV